MTPTDSSTIHNTKSIITFITITFLLSGVFYYFIINGDSLTTGMGMYTLGLMWCPGIAAIITLLTSKKSIKEIGWKWGKTKFQLQSYLLPFLYALIGYSLIWWTGWGKFHDATFVSMVADRLGMQGQSESLVILIYVMQEAILGVIIGAIFALGEEIGWRGFLTPTLYKSYGFTKTSVITGLIWGIWHLPLIIWSDYNNNTAVWYSCICFMILILNVSFIFTWYRIKSGSIWTAVLLHASHNVFVQSIFTPLTADTGLTVYFVDEFGATLPLISLFFAFYFWSQRNKLSNKNLTLNNHL